MRQILIDRIRIWGDWDYLFKDKFNPSGGGRVVVEDYVQYLEKLDDEDLLETYERVKEITDNLD